MDGTAYRTTKRTPLVIAGPGVLVNDVDVGDTVTVSAYDHTSAVGAAVTLAANGGFSYDPGGLFDRIIGALIGDATGDGAVDAAEVSLADQ